MGSLERFPGPLVGTDNRGGLPIAVDSVAGRRVVMPSGEAWTESPAIRDPGWDGLPEAVRWTLAGRDPLTGGVLATYSAPSSVARTASADYVERTSGWAVHQNGVFHVEAHRRLKPIGRKRFEPAGNWELDFGVLPGAKVLLEQVPPDPMGTTAGMRVRSTHSFTVQDVHDLLPARARSLVDVQSSRPGADAGSSLILLQSGESVTHTLRFERRTSEQRIGVVARRSAVVRTDITPDEGYRLLSAIQWELVAFRSGPQPQLDAGPRPSGAALPPVPR